MTADLYAQAKAAIAGKRAMLAAGTVGPWLAAVGSGPVRRKQQHALIGQADMRGQGAAGCIAVFAGIDGHKADDAELAVAAVNDYGLLLDALDGILALHEPGAPLDSGALRCRGEHNVVVQAWPCADTRAVLTALGVTS